MTDERFIFEWSGAEIIVSPYTVKLCREKYGAGRHRLRLIEEPERKNRSRESHNHFFAMVEQGWHNLPETFKDRLRTANQLRKWCLIKAGFRHEKNIVLASHEEALRVATFVQPPSDDDEWFAVVTVVECTVTVYTAMSMKEIKMDKAVFEAAKRAVFEVIGGLIGVPNFGEDTYTPIALHRPRRQRKAASKPSRRTSPARERKAGAA